MITGSVLFVGVLALTCMGCFAYALYDLWVSRVTDVDMHTHDYFLSREELPVVIFYTFGQKYAEQNTIYEEVAHQLPWVRFLRADLERWSAFQYQLHRRPSESEVHLPQFKVHLRVHAHHDEHQEHNMNSFQDDVHIIGSILDEDDLLDAIKEALAELNNRWEQWMCQVKENAQQIASTKQHQHPCASPATNAYQLPQPRG